MAHASFQRRLKRLMIRREWRVADLARAFDEPYMTVYEWATNDRQPATKDKKQDLLEKLTKLELEEPTK